MEKITNKDTNNLQENLVLNARKELKLEGVVEILNSSETTLNLKLKNTSMIINGENINIKKLDVNQGILEATGIFNSIKYGKTSGNIFKRMFKWKYPIFYN